MVTLHDEPAGQLLSFYESLRNVLQRNFYFKVWKNSRNEIYLLEAEWVFFTCVSLEDFMPVKKVSWMVPFIKNCWKLIFSSPVFFFAVKMHSSEWVCPCFIVVSAVCKWENSGYDWMFPVQGLKDSAAARISVSKRIFLYYNIRKCKVSRMAGKKLRFFYEIWNFLLFCIVHIIGMGSWKSWFYPFILFFQLELNHSLEYG